MATRSRTTAEAEPLGRERIVRATLALIDEHGVAAFNLRALADKLGVYPTAIYWHVPGRNELIAGAVSLAMQDVAAGLAGGAWQQRLRSLLQRFRAALRAHPHLAPIVASELVHSASLDAVLLDQVVAMLEEAGFAGAALVDAFNVVIAAMCGFATLELSAAPAQNAEDWEAACRERLAAIPPETHPALARYLSALRNKAFMVRWSSGAKHPLASGFAAWCDVIVAGLEAKASAPQSAAKTPRASRSTRAAKGSAPRTPV